MHYTVVIQWSVEDDCFVVLLPEWADTVHMPVTDGNTYEEAARKGGEVLEMLIESNQEEGKPLPEPQPYVSDD